MSGEGRSVTNRRIRSRWAVPLATCVAVAALAGCGSSGTLTPSGPAGDVAEGQRVYERSCARCHGIGGRGTDQGPPFLDRVYEPSHHGDASFLLAVRNGVPAHHWNFGDMKPQPGVSDTEVADIVAYVRSIQRDAGIH